MSRNRILTSGYEHSLLTGLALGGVSVDHSERVVTRPRRCSERAVPHPLEAIGKPPRGRTIALRGRFLSQPRVILETDEQSDTRLGMRNLDNHLKGVAVMARSDLLLDLVEAERSGDRRRFQMVVESMIAEERSKQHHLVADRLEEIISTSGATAQVGTDRYGSPPITQDGLVAEIVPRRRLADVALSEENRQAVTEVVEEHQRSDLLRSHNLEPRHRLLLVGPPGNGKTTVAEAIAAELMAPLFVVSYDALISSYLGETASRLAALFEFARTRECVLFFDEFETIAKERADANDTGELKRVVASLLLGIDRLPAHVVLVGASNHSELLDRAAWRRFQVRINLPSPTQAQIISFVQDLGRRSGGFGVTPETIAKNMSGASYAEVEELILDVRRRYIIGLPEADLKKTARERLRRWRNRAT